MLSAKAHTTIISTTAKQKRVSYNTHNTSHSKTIRSSSLTILSFNVCVYIFAITMLVFRNSLQENKYAL